MILGLIVAPFLPISNHYNLKWLDMFIHIQNFGLNSLIPESDPINSWTHAKSDGTFQHVTDTGYESTKFVRFRLLGEMSADTSEVSSNHTYNLHPRICCSNRCNLLYIQRYLPVSGVSFCFPPFRPFRHCSCFGFYPSVASVFIATADLNQ